VSSRLPVGPDLGFHRKRAKDLKRALAAGDESAARRVASFALTTFHDCNFDRTTFSNVSLAGARFDNVNLADVRIGDAHVTGMTIYGIEVQPLLHKELERRAKAQKPT